MARWSKGEVVIHQEHGATVVELAGHAVLIDAPPTAVGLASGTALVGVVFTSGRLERISGLLEVMREHADLELWLPLADDRAALVGELARSAWDCSVTLDALTPGMEVPVAAGSLSVHGLFTSDDAVALGVRLQLGPVVVAYVPKCRVDGAARRLVRGADVVVIEPGFLDTQASLVLAGRSDLLFTSIAEA